MSDPGQQGAPAPRPPRRIVLLEGDEKSAVERVLSEHPPQEAAGSKMHAELRRVAAEHPGRVVALEWLDRTGWSRFMWCRGEGA